MKILSVVYIFPNFYFTFHDLHSDVFLVDFHNCYPAVDHDRKPILAILATKRNYCEKVELQT
jgi:hypothetical protein